MPKEKTSMNMATATKIVDERERIGLGSATVERIHKAGRDVETGDHGLQRLVDWPIRHLSSRGLLGNGPNDESGNAVRTEAAERYYAHWYFGQLDSLASRDYRSPQVDYGGIGGIFPSGEWSEHNRSCFRSARSALWRGDVHPDRIARATDMIVLDEVPIATVAVHLSWRSDSAQLRVLAIEWLVDGLDRLRWHWRKP